MGKVETGKVRDAVVVLGTRVRPDGSPSPALRRRTVKGAEAVRDGAAPLLVLSGGGRHKGLKSGEAPPEADVMQALAEETGVERRQILLEPDSRNTFENALNTAALLHARRARRVLVVSDRFHLPRALFVFRRLGLEAEGLPAYPPNYRRRGMTAYLRFREAMAWINYLYLVYVARRRRMAAVREKAFPDES